MSSFIIPLELEIYNFGLFTDEDDDEEISLHVREAGIKTATFFSINAIAPEEEKDGFKYSSIFVGGDIFSCIYEYEVLKDIISEHILLCNKKLKEL